MSFEAEQFDKDLSALLDACLAEIPEFDNPFSAIGAVQNWINEVQKAAEQMIPWLEESDRDDPRANGWVGQDGRP